MCQSQELEPQAELLTAGPFCREGHSGSGYRGARLGGNRPSGICVDRLNNCMRKRKNPIGPDGHTAVGENGGVSYMATETEEPDTITGLLLSFWQHLDKERHNENLNLTRVLNALRAVPVMDWVYGFGYSSLEARDQLRVRAQKFFVVFPQFDADDKYICLEECREILSNPLCSEVLHPDEIARMKELVAE